MRFGSVCSGIEAASVAWHPLGWRAAWLSEIEPFPSAVLAHHYPDVPNLGDMTTLPRRIMSGEVEAPDVFCGGTPCQAFSVAGLRKSLDDARGNLSLTFCEIANAIDYVRSVRSAPPAVIFWENVPGVLSTADNAFGCFLGALAGEDEPLVAPGGKWANAGCVFGPQRAVAWRVLDAQYFGVAQRRRRVFVVASARDGFDPAAVLFEFDGVRRDTAPSREARQTVAGGVEIGPGGGRFTDLNPTLDTRAKDGPVRNQLAGAVLHAPEIARCIATREGSSQDWETTTMVAQPISIHPHCIGRAPEAGPQGKEYLLDGSAYCMDSRGQPQAVAQPVAFHPTQDPISSTDGTTHGLACGSSGGQASVAVAFQSSQSGVRIGETHATLDANNGPRRHNGALVGMQVRRLTPVECERLQGFPDNYTAIPWRKKPAAECPDGPRYKALGNSWAVPVVRWIGARIQAAVS
jgi:DNA (cytosine-5)-methyltransferase 1